jgi:hypothetical protein
MRHTLTGPLPAMVAAHAAEDVNRARLDASPERSFIRQLCLDIDCCHRLAAPDAASIDPDAANHFRWLAEGLLRALELSACQTEVTA